MKKNKLIIISMFLLILAAIITGCTSSNSGQTSTPAPSTDKNTVIIQEFKFQPAEITINKGETVTWINEDTAGHDVFGTSIKSAILKKGESYKQTFNEAGTYDYKCGVHPSMTGKVIVK